MTNLKWRARPVIMKTIVLSKIKISWISKKALRRFFATHFKQCSRESDCHRGTIWRQALLRILHAMNRLWIPTKTSTNNQWIIIQFKISNSTLINLKLLNRLSTIHSLAYRAFHRAETDKRRFRIDHWAPIFLDRAPFDNVVLIAVQDSKLAQAKTYPIVRWISYVIDVVMSRKIMKVLRSR